MESRNSAESASTCKCRLPPGTNQRTVGTRVVKPSITRIAATNPKPAAIAIWPAKMRSEMGRTPAASAMIPLVPERTIARQTRSSFMSLIPRVKNAEGQREQKRGEDVELVNVELPLLHPAQPREAIGPAREEGFVHVAGQR